MSFSRIAPITYALFGYASTETREPDYLSRPNTIFANRQNKYPTVNDGQLFRLTHLCP